MRFFAEQRRAWVRTHTHTQILDRDPDFDRFSRDESGEVRRLYRIWFAGKDQRKVYLGCLRLCSFARSDLTRLFRRVRELPGYPARELSARLAGFLRGITSPAASGE